MEIEVPEEFHKTHGVWDKARLQKEWKLWDARTREDYVYWREIALELTDDPFLAANFSAAKALAWRRMRGCGTSKVLFPDVYKQDGLNLDPVEAYDD